MDYKQETKKAYNLYAEYFEEHSAKFFDESLKEEADSFIAALKGKKILDHGSGAGAHASYLQQKGFDVLCIDNSEEAVKLCKKKGLNAKVMDIEQLDLPENSFDGVWSCCSLLHVKKESAKTVINQIVKVLKPEGIVSLALIEGEGESFVESETQPGTKRWFAFFKQDDVRALFEEHFDIIDSSRKPVETSTSINVRMRLNFLMRLKK